jgi:formylmethanofuran dehydrogenase subunit C
VRARRGVVVVGGDAGELAARSMIAGTLVVLGRTGAKPGFGNKRGSIVAAGAISIPTTYRYACTLESTFVRMLMVYLGRRHGLSIPEAVAGGRYKRYCGDLGRPGKGEILEWSGQ